MKKALYIVGILFIVLIVVPLIAGAIGGAALDVFSVLYAAAIIALPFILVGLLVHRLRKRKAHATEVVGPATPEQEPQQATPPPQQRQTVKVTKTTVVPTADESDNLDIDDDIAYRYTNVGVFVPYTEVFGHPALIEGAIVSFRQEPENKHDPHAVAVVIGRKRIGYLFRGKLQEMVNDWLDRGDAVSGRVIRVDPDAVDAKSNGIRINLYLYN